MIFSSNIIKCVLSAFLIAYCLSSFGQAKKIVNGKIENTSLTQFVNPYIGSGGHGHVFVGANVPYGAVQLGPNNLSQGWDWCSGYHISDSTIIGFAHQHLSGTGIGDLSDIIFLPYTGDIKLLRGNHQEETSGAFSYFKRSSEIVRPGFYSVHLDRFNVDAELTATTRVGFHRYKYNNGEVPKVLINLEAAVGWEGDVVGHIVVENDSVVSGFRYSYGWAKKQKIFFTAKFSVPFSSFELSDSTSFKPGNSITSPKSYGQFIFDKQKLKDGEELLVKVSLSPVSVENAKLNMRQELNFWDFDSTVKNANKQWNEELGKIRIETQDKTQRTIFYTALYHTMIAPSVFNDVNGEYIGADYNTHQLNYGNNYTTLSLWDTYRAAQPLMSLIHQERVPDIVNTMLRIYQEQGRLPVWHLVGNETDCMVGNPGIIVVADAYLKGINGFDKDLAYEAMIVSAMKDDRGLKWLKEYGYIPFDKEDTESVAKGLEFAIADWSLAQVAKIRGEKNDYEYFLNRSNSFSYYFDKNLQFMRGIDSKGRYREGIFDPFHSAHLANDYTEGNAWQYTWLVPHNVNGLINLFGGEKALINKLDSLFVVQGDLGKDASPDISGLIGQYAHGNEPSHHVNYLYSYVGQPWKVAERVRETMKLMYSNEVDGLSGNEDVGQMSAWYVLSALGFYQVSPAGGPFIFGSPLFEKSILKLSQDKTLTILAKNNSFKNIYIQKVFLNGVPYHKSYISYSELLKGGVLEFHMGDKPSSNFGVSKSSRPFSIQ